MIPFFSYDQISFGSLKVYPWGFFVGLAFVTGLFLFQYLAKKKEYNVKVIYNLSLFVLIGSLIGAKLGYLFQFPHLLFENPLQLLTDWQQGLTFHGGLIGALLAGYIYIKKKSLSFWPLADLAVLPLILGIIIGRLGCFLVNDHQGMATHLPWGILWPDNILRHPVALYLIINGLVMLAFFWFLKNRLHRSGHLFLYFLIWYGLARFLLDFTRFYDPQVFNLYISQWLSLAVVIAAIYLLSKNKIK